jgi:hypothetical protein
MPIHQYIPTRIPISRRQAGSMPYQVTYMLLPTHAEMDADHMGQHAYEVVEAATQRIVVAGVVRVGVRSTGDASATIFTNSISLVPWLVMALSSMPEVMMISVNAELCFLSGEVDALPQDLMAGGTSSFSCLDAREEAAYGGFMERAGIPPPIDISLDGLLSAD